MLTLVKTVQKWRPYLLGAKFVVRIDQKSLQFFLGQTISTATQQKWLVKLLGFDFQIQYKRGREKNMADALSRKSNILAYALSMPIPNWIDPIKSEILANQYLQDIVERIQQGEAVGP